MSYTEITADVGTYSPYYKPRQIKIVDSVVQYDFLPTDVTYMLLIRNSLYVPSMKNNLVPHFIMREAGINIKDTPKIQVKDLSV